MKKRRLYKSLKNKIDNLKPYNKNFTSFPKDIHFAITNRCNLSCEFCGQNRKKWHKNNELTFDHYKNLINQISTMPDTMVSFGGGEIFLHQDMDKILTYCFQKNVPINMVLTNGILLNEERINLLIDCNINFVGFSIDGINGSHDHIRGMKGAYEKTIYAIKTMVELKQSKKVEHPRIGINFVITNKNLDDMEAVVEVASELEINTLSFSYLNYISEKKLSEHKAYMKHIYSDFDFCYWEGFENNHTAIDAARLAKIIKKINNHNGKKPRINFSNNLNKRKIHKWYHSDETIFKKCTFFSCFFILPNGDYPLCDFNRYPVGNIKDSSLVDLWQNSTATNFRNSIQKKIIPGCERCCSVR